MKQRIIFILMAAIIFSALFANSANAADWEWTLDKGWAQGAGRARPTAEEQLSYAWELEQDKRYQNAAQQYFLLLKTWPDNEEAGVALQRLANCLFKLENYYDSFQALEQVIKSYPNSIKKNDLLKIEFLIGRKFQSGVKRDLLNMNEAPAAGLNAAIEIFKAVINNDPVGPYSGAAHLAVADCYRKIDNPREAVVWYDRVLEQYSFSNELVAKAELGKDLAKVALGTENVEEANAKRVQLESLINDQQDRLAEGAGNEDFAPVSDLKTEFNELYDKAAEKLWQNASFYKKRGTYESMQAYKFTLELITTRYPNTRYASAARQELTGLKIPDSEPRSIGKFNVPFVKKDPPPTFVTAQNSPEHIEIDRVSVPGINEEQLPQDEVAAAAEPWLPRSAATGNAMDAAARAENLAAALAENDSGVYTAAVPAAPVRPASFVTRSDNLEVIDGAGSGGMAPIPEGTSAVPVNLYERMENAGAYRTAEQIERARQVSQKNETVAAQNNWSFADDF